MGAFLCCQRIAIMLAPALAAAARYSWIGAHKLSRVLEPVFGFCVLELVTSCLWIFVEFSNDEPGQRHSVVQSNEEAI